MKTALPLSGAEQVRLSCPYRKRNRARFNIRNQPRCANAFQHISVLKSALPAC
jgi:hypothetical protein